MIQTHIAIRPARIGNQPAGHYVAMTDEKGQEIRHIHGHGEYDNLNQLFGEDITEAQIIEFIQNCVRHLETYEGRMQELRKLLA